MTDLRSGPACSMLCRASRTSRASELLWPLGKETESGCGRRKQEESREEEEAEEGLWKRETGLFDTDEMEDVEEEQVEVEDEGLAFCVGI